jgi:hypothetical protein
MVEPEAQLIMEIEDAASPRLQNRHYGSPQQAYASGVYKGQFSTRQWRSLVRRLKDDGALKRLVYVQNWNFLSELSINMDWRVPLYDDI